MLKGVSEMHSSQEVPWSQLSKGDSFSTPLLGRNRACEALVEIDATVQVQVESWNLQPVASSRTQQTVIILPRRPAALP